MHFTFPGGLLYLNLAQYQAEDAKQGQENEGTGDHDPAARPALEQALEEVEVEREHPAAVVLTQRVTAGQVDQRGHYQQSHEQGHAERDRFEFWWRQRKIVVAHSREPGEQLLTKLLSPAGRRTSARIIAHEQNQGGGCRRRLSRPVSCTEVRAARGMRAGRCGRW